MQVTDGATAPAGNKGIREGNLEGKDLLEGRDGTPNNYSMVIGTSQTEYAAPRHTHNFEQVRFNVKGEIRYGDKVFPEGWVTYFPESVHYGPQVRKLGSQTVTAQFGGAAGNGYISKKRQKEAYAALEKKGEFKKGVFTYMDADGKRHNRDAFEALFEQAMSRDFEYAPRRYDDIVIMNPESYAWHEPRNAGGVAYKWLGTFTERETEVGFIRLEPGAVYKAGAQPSPELLFLAEGAVECDGRVYGPHSAFGMETNEGPLALKAKEVSRLLYIRLPKF